MVLIIVVAVVGLYLFIYMNKRHSDRRANERERRQRNYEKLMDTLKMVRENNDDAADNKTQDDK
jgi:hypothetical protein